MHFPEEQLTTYLRAFTPEDRIDALLDQVAQAAIDSEAQETVELYALAHGVMAPDDRRTPDLEAVVLVEEVGLDVDDVATVLDIDRTQVEAAVADAWMEVAEGRAAPRDRAATATTREPAADGPAADRATSDAPTTAAEPQTRSWRGRGRPPTVAAAPGTAAEVVEDERPGRPAWQTAAAVMTTTFLVVLAVAVFSEAGQQRLAAQGFNPIIAFGSVVGLLVVGGLLLVLGRDDQG